jgi:hypothetical protein
MFGPKLHQKDANYDGDCDGRSDKTDRRDELPYTPKQATMPMKIVNADNRGFFVMPSRIPSVVISVIEQMAL